MKEEFTIIKRLDKLFIYGKYDAFIDYEGKRY